MNSIKLNQGVDIPIYTKLFINNEYVESEAKTTIDVINPSTEKIICSISEGREADIDKAVSAAKIAFKEWEKVGLDRKVKMFFNLADLLEKQVKEFSYLESLDNGKIIGDAENEINNIVEIIRYHGGWSDKLTGNTFTTAGDYTIQTRRVPFGVVGLISPWNYPLKMCAWKIFPALAAGNTIVLKPSEETPLTILKLCSLFKEAGFPPGVLNVVPGYGHLAGDRLSMHSDVSNISLTGSTLTGRKIMKASAETNLKKVHLELGGKSPIIVFNDADLEIALTWAINAAFKNSSQNCCCGSRLFIQEGIYEEFLKKMVEQANNIKVGDAFEPETNIGPVINERQFKSILGYINHGKNVEKLKMECGGGRLYEKGYFIQPTIFSNVPDDSKLAKEEIFGPVICVMKPFITIQEAVERANNTDYGLCSGIFSTDTATQEYFARNIQTGGVCINNYKGSMLNVPFGGMKQSGFGRDNGFEVLLEYTTVKSIYYKNDLSKFNDN